MLTVMCCTVEAAAPDERVAGLRCRVASTTGREMMICCGEHGCPVCRDPVRVNKSFAFIQNGRIANSSKKFT